MILAILGLLACTSSDTNSGPAVDSAQTDDTAVADCSQADTRFFEQSAAPLLETRCYGCHNANGVAASTRHVLLPFDTEANREANMDMLRSLVADTEDGAQLLLQKPSGQVSHGGGEVIDPLSSDFAVLSELVSRLVDPGHCDNPGEPPMTCEDGQLYPGTTPYRRLTDQQYTNAIRDLVGVEVPAGLFPETKKAEDFRTWSSNNVVSSGGVEGILAAAEYIAEAINLTALMNCSESESEEACARRFLADLGFRAYRRPLSPAETAVLESFLNSGVDTDTAIRMGLEILFTSPQFLYIDAAGLEPVSEGAEVQYLDPYAVASRLSFFFLNTTPDNELIEAAEAGRLRTREEVREQALRLAQDPRFLDTLHAFHEDWLNLYQLQDAAREAEMYPSFSEDLLASMRTETELFLGEVIWGGAASFADLLTSQTTWVDSRLAALYEIDDPGPGWHRVSLSAERPGILTRSAFLTAHAYTGSSAPIKRGSFVLKELLCEELSVPADVNTVIPEESEEAQTIRERLSQHQSDPSCAGCHDKIDPIGFSFEHFDAIGAWREHWENGIPIDASGSLNESVFNGAAALIELTAAEDAAKECYARRWFEYAIGRPTETEDLCTLDTLGKRFLASEGSIQNLVVDIAMSDAFLFRAELEAE